MSTPSSPETPAPRRRKETVHEVVFVAYPKLLFTWPLILAGLVFWPFGDHVLHPETLGWVYVVVLTSVILTLGVDVNRNQAAFWFVLFGAFYFLGLYLKEVKNFTLFGELYRLLDGLDVQYNRSFGLAVSAALSIPFAVMLVWARLNDRWRITHNEFEHYSLGKMDDSLGRGAKTIRTSYPDIFEMLFGLAGTLVVYNASGTTELRRIPHVMFLPFVRKRLNKVLEKTAVTAVMSEEEEEEVNI